MAKQQGPSPFDPRGLVAGFGAALQVIGSRKAAGVPVSELIQQTGHAFWSTTQAYYVPNKMEFQVDGGIWGARYQAVTEIKRSQEFAIATNSIARELGGSEWKVMADPTPGNQGNSDAVPLVDPNHPLIKLLRHPNPLHTWQSWIETATLLLVPTGNCYILKDPMSQGGTPMALWLLRPDRTRPIRLNDPLHPIQAYEHFRQDGTRDVFPADRIIHIKLPNPEDDYQGLGTVETLSLTLEMDVKSMESNINLFRQGGRLSTIVEGFEDDPEKIKAFIREVQEAHMGSQNAHKVLVMTGESKINTQASNAAPREVDYAKTRQDISRAVGGMLGVPPMMMGQLDQINRATATVQQQQFYNNAVWPMMKRFTPALDGICKMFGDEFSFQFPMAEVLDADTLPNLMRFASETGAYSPNDILEKFLRQPRSKAPGMDDHYIINTQVSIEKGGGLPPPIPAKPAAPAPGAAPQPTKPAQAPTAPAQPQPNRRPSPVPPKKSIEPWAGPLSPVPRMGVKSVAAPPNLSGKTKDADGRPFPRGTAAQRKHLAAIRAARPKIENAIAPIFEKHFRAVAKQATAELMKRGPAGGRAVKKENVPSMVAGIMKAYDASGTPAGLAEDTANLYQAQLSVAAQDASSIFGVNMASYTPSSADFSAARTYLAQRITGVDQAIKDKIAGIITDAAEQGLSPWEIANGTTDGSFPGLTSATDDMAQENAMLIARTETTHLQDAVNTAAYGRMGVSTCDCIGCQDFKIMPGETYGCNSQDIPVSALPVQFHPNHNGAVVPQIPKV